jgi:hypothetical protein
VPYITQKTKSAALRAAVLDLEEVLAVLEEDIDAGRDFHFRGIAGRECTARIADTARYLAKRLKQLPEKPLPTP